MKRTTFLLLSTLLACASLAGQEGRVPTFEQVIELRRPGGVALSPDGSMVAFTVNETNWDENAFETEIHLARTDGSPVVQLTRGKKSSTSPVWSPDGKWLAFVSDRTDKRQIYLIAPAGGEAHAITNVEEGVGAFRWSNHGRQIAFTMTDPKNDARKDRDKKFGEFEVVDQDWRMTHLHVIDVDPAAAEPAKPRRLTEGAFTVGSFDWSPDSRSIAFDHRVDPNLINGATADISVVAVADRAIRKVVTKDGSDSNPRWSPDGTQLAFVSARNEKPQIYILPMNKPGEGDVRIASSNYLPNRSS